MKLLTYKPSDLLASLAELHEHGLPAGTTTGWPSVDRFYKPCPGQLTVLTGWPGSGKSEWLDALMLNLARQGWRFAIFSPENMPITTHLVKFLEKFTGRPFGHGPTERMSASEAQEAAVEISQWFGFMRSNPMSDKLSFNISEVLEEAQEWLEQMAYLHSENPCGLVIDPWNELEHWRPQNMSETEYVSATLSEVRQWARSNNVHVWIVAHPQKLRRDESGKLPIPRPDSISGSQHWWNKADNCITVWRALDEDSQDVDVCVQKVRFKHLGRPGIAQLKYDRISGRYFELPPKLVRADMDR